ncbi:MAG: hypothetical protein RIS76_4433 [Verrucomicrobiota bacterium]
MLNQSLQRVPARFATSTQSRSHISFKVQPGFAVIAELFR